MNKKQRIKINPKKPKIQIKIKENSASDKINSNVAIKKNQNQSRIKLVKLLRKNIFHLIGVLLFGLGIILFLLNNFSPEKRDKSKTFNKEVKKSNFSKTKEALEETETSLTELLANLKEMNGYRQKMTILDSKTKIKSLLKKEDLPLNALDELLILARDKNLEVLEKDKIWYSIKAKTDNQATMQLFIYEKSPTLYYVIKALPIQSIYVVKKDQFIKVRSIAGIIKTSLWDAVRESNGDDRIVEKIEEALKWQIDLFHIKPNDKFKLIYEEKWVEDKMIDVGNLLALTFHTNNKRYTAFYLNENNTEGYFDKYGRSMKRKFLKSPVKLNRITSPYNPERVHPVLGGIRPHLGTDYYAKKGEPIYAVGDGIITEARFKKNNGNYIKIKHDNIYQTQYLHIMDDGFAEGIKRGVKVKQGQVIGYAGSTGLATGVHVCFRFWKNGKQVDPLKEKIVHNKKPAKIDLESFETKRDSLLERLSEIPYFDLTF